MNKRLMIFLALNNLVLGGAIVLTHDRLGALATIVNDNFGNVANQLLTFSVWSADIADRLNSMYLFLLGP